MLDSQKINMKYFQQFIDLLSNYLLNSVTIQVIFSSLFSARRNI